MNMKRIAFATAAATVALLSASGASAQTVAIVTGSFYTPDLKNQLVAKGFTVTEVASYSAASLSGYSAVIQDGNSFVDQTALTSYVTAGGRLVLLPWSGLNYAVQPQLQIFNNGGSAQHSIANPGITVLAPGNSLLTGVTFPAAGAPNIGRISGIDFVAGATQVTDWGDGVGMLGYRSLGAGQVFGLNMHLITSDTAYQVVDTPWASQLVGNIVGGQATGAVPEPATWAMMLIGFGAIGGTLRRRQKVTARIRFA
jgi:hypothetical protein